MGWALSLYAFACLSVPEGKETSFFSQEIKRNTELFRVFIARELYLVKQMQAHNNIARTPDENGDKEKQGFFTKEHDKINFRNYFLEGTLLVTLHPVSAKIINIQYEKGAMPRTWQASKHFVQDLARFRFRFLNEKRQPSQFHVEYMWQIEAESSISEASRKKKAIQYLRSQRRTE